MLKLFTSKKKRTARPVSLPKRAARRQRLSFRTTAPRPPGPFRPQRLPRLSKNRKIGLFFWGVILIIVLFCLGHIWKAQQVAYLCVRLDGLRRQQQALLEGLKAAELSLQEASTYSKIEPLARERLGMQPSTTPPLALAPLDERFLALQNASYESGTQKQE